MTNAELMSENRKLREELAQLKLDVHQLEVMLRLQRMSQFAPSSERYVATPLFPGAAQSTPAAEDQEAREEVKAHLRRKKKRSPIPDNAVKEVISHDIPESDRICPVHGVDLSRGADRKIQRVEWIPAVVKVIEHVSATYCCPICDRTVKVAEPPASPIPGSIATPSLLAQIATSKFADGLPLYRQETILARAGIELTRTTMATWMGRVATMLTSLCNLYNDLLLHSPVLFVDETHLQVLKVPGKAATSKSYLWVRVGHVDGKKIVLFHFDPTRSSEVPVALLDGYRGFVTTDDYSGYNKIERMPGIRRLQCWMHVRRYFHKALKALGKHGRGGIADQALSRIRELYAIERECVDFDVETRRRHRLEFAKPKLDGFREWLEGARGDLPPKSATAKAVTHALDVWHYLVVYLEDGHLLMDNGPAENAIRPVAVGRKNFLFCDSVEGAEATAVLYSIIETAKAHGFDPFSYLRIVIDRLTTALTIEDVEALLPWNIRETLGDVILADRSDAQKTSLS
jgi:transposase